MLLEDAEDDGNEEAAGDLKKIHGAGQTPAGAHQRRARPLEDRSRQDGHVTFSRPSTIPQMVEEWWQTIETLIQEERQPAA